MNLLERLLKEFGELEEKIVKLDEFIKSKNFQKVGENQQFFLRKQLFFMNAYHDVLVDRIKDIEEPGDYYKTFGEDFIGDFGIENEDIFNIKMVASLLVDEINISGNNQRRKAVANTNIETAVMYGVKSIF